MKHLKLQDIIRLLIYIPILYGVYTETGLFTTGVMFLIVLEIEINNIIRKIRIQHFDHLTKILSTAISK